MYDWNALWHTHQGYRTGYTAPQDDINNLAAELGAKQIKAAKNRGDIAVYQTDDQFILVGHVHRPIDASGHPGTTHRPIKTSA